MTESDTHIRSVLSQNLSALMKHHHWTGKHLQARSGVSSSTIDNIRRDRINATITNVAKIAQAFGMPAWALLAPGLDVTSSGPDLSGLLQDYLRSSSDGRTAIRRLALSEANLAESDL